MKFLVMFLGLAGCTALPMDGALLEGAMGSGGEKPEPVTCQCNITSTCN